MDGIPGAGFTTRAELLSEQGTRVAEIERRRYGWRRDVMPAIAQSFVLVGLVLAVQLEDDPTRDEVIVLGSVSVAAMTLGALMLVWRAVRSHRLSRERRHWMGIDQTREARSLPPGDIPDDLLTPFDVRDSDDADLRDRVAQRVSRRNAMAMYDNRALLWPSLRTIPGLVLGLVFLLSGVDEVLRFVGTDGLRQLEGAVNQDESASSLVLLTLGGAILFIANGTAMWTTFVDNFRRQQVANLAYQHHVQAVRSAVLRGDEVEPSPRVPWVTTIVLGVLGFALAVFLVSGLLAASPAVLAALAAIGLLAGLLVGVPLWRKRALHVVPQTTGGDTVVDPPARRVAVDLADGVIVIGSERSERRAFKLDLDEVLAVVDVRLGYPFAPPAVGLVTREENIVLAGAGVGDLPAIRAAREATTTAQSA